MYYYMQQNEASDLEEWRHEQEEQDRTSDLEEWRHVRVEQDHAYAGSLQNEEKTG